MRFQMILAALVAGALSACSTTPDRAAPATTEAAEASPALSPAEIESMRTQGRELTDLFYAGETGTIWSRMTGEMQEALKTEGELAAFQQKVRADLGTETEVLDEKVLPAPPYRVYLRVASFSDFGGPITVQWTLDEEDRVAGFFVRPAQ